jgi:putative oxidoreductase
MTLLLSTKQKNTQAVIGAIRILVGLFMIYHGKELFESEKIDEYAKWINDLHLPAPRTWALIGKASELAGGIFLMLGWFTRMAVIPLAGTMLFIIFVIGHGKIWMDDQYPFLFLLLLLIFFVNGPGNWSVDGLIKKRKA